MLRSVLSMLSSPFSSEASLKNSGERSKGGEGGEESSKAWQKLRGSPSHITEISSGSDVELIDNRVNAQAADRINVHTSLRSVIGRA